MGVSGSVEGDFALSFENSEEAGQPSAPPQSHWVGTANDPSWSVRAEEVLGFLPHAFLLVEHGQVVWANEAACAMVQAAEPVQLIGLDVQQLLPLVSDWGQFSAEASRQNREATLQSFLGRKQSAAVRIYGEKTGRQLLLLDTPEQALPSARNKDDSRLAGLGMLVAGVAHEINNPLTFVLPALHDSLRLLDAIPATVPQKSELANLLEDALLGVQRVAKIASDLREFKRSDDVVSDVDINAVVADTLKLADARLRGQVKVRHTLGLPVSVLVNSSRLSQVILNLVLNAAQSMDPGQKRTSQIMVRTWQTGVNVYISVEDNGCGIEQSQIDRIFDPFFSTKNAGTGLGLSVCAGIVKRMGGWIEVDSTPGVGSVFRVVLPAGDSLQSPANALRRVEHKKEKSEPPLPHRFDEAQSLHLLVVDDEPLVIRSVKRMIGPSATVRQAFGAWEAISLLREGLEVDCVVSDMVMPEGGGMELWAWVQANRPELGERFCFMTGMAPAEGSDPSLPPTIHKPFSVQELTEKLSLRAALGTGISV